MRRAILCVVLVTVANALILHAPAPAGRLRRRGRVVMEEQQDMPRWLEVRGCRQIMPPRDTDSCFTRSAVVLHSCVQGLLYGRAGKPRPAGAPVEPEPEPVSRYVPPEEDPRWGAMVNATLASVRWEQRVQWEAQRTGNSVRQNEILQRELNK